MTMTENAPHANDELQHLRAENMRLKRLLVSHGIAWEEPRDAEIAPVVAEAEPETHFTIAEKSCESFRLSPLLSNGASSRRDLRPLMPKKSVEGKSHLSDGDPPGVVEVDTSSNQL